MIDANARFFLQNSITKQHHLHTDMQKTTEGILLAIFVLKFVLEFLFISATDPVIAQLLNACF